MQQTVQRRSGERTERYHRRVRFIHETSTAGSVFVGAGIFAFYLFLAQQMQGIDWDTIFLSLYLAVLTVFIIRSFIFALWPQLEKES